MKARDSRAGLGEGLEDEAASRRVRPAPPCPRGRTWRRGRGRRPRRGRRGGWCRRPPSRGRGGRCGRGRRRGPCRGSPPARRRGRSPSVSHGLKRRTPVPSKSLVLRVQRVRSWTRAVAAMRPSEGGRTAPRPRRGGQSAPRLGDRQGHGKDALAVVPHNSFVVVVSLLARSVACVRRERLPEHDDAQARRVHDCRRPRGHGNPRGFQPRRGRWCRAGSSRNRTHLAPGERSRLRSTPSKDGPLKRYSPRVIFFGSPSGSRTPPWKSARPLRPGG